MKGKTHPIDIYKPTCDTDGFNMYVIFKHSLTIFSTNTQVEKLQLMGREKDCQKLRTIIEGVASRVETRKKNPEREEKKATESKEATEPKEGEVKEKKEEEKTTVILLSGEAGIGLLKPGYVSYLQAKQFC